MKKVLAMILVLVLVIGVFAGCGKKFLNTADAEKVALQDLGIKAKDADSIHTHGGESDNGSVYSVHVEYNGQTYEYIIQASDGTILSSGIAEGH